MDTASRSAHLGKAPPPAQTRMKAVRRDTLSTRVYAEVKRALLTGRFQPGEPITLRALAEELEVGVMPIREVVQRLVTEGALSSLENGRFRVPRLDRRSFDDLFAIRVRVEGLAAALAAERVTEAKLASLEALYEAWTSEVKAGTPQSIIEANYRFQFAIYEAADSEHLLSIIDSLWLRFSPLLIHPLKRTAQERDKYIAMNDDFQALLVCLRERDAAKAEQIIKDHINTAAAWYRENYPF